MTQAALLGTSLDTSALTDLNIGKMIWLALAGLAVWAFKKDWIGIVTFGPYDRGFREFLGRPRKLLCQGPHPHIIGLGNLRRASVATTTMAISNRVTIEERVYLYKLQIGTRIVDQRDRIYAAIYETFDEGKKDQYNAQRIAYVTNKIEEAVRNVLESSGSTESVTVEHINQKCRDHLLLMCGTEVTQVMITEFTAVDAQIIKDGVLESGTPDGGRTVIPFQSHSHSA